MNTWIYALSLLMVLVPSAAAEETETVTPDTSKEAVALLRSVSETYQEIESFHFEALESSISNVNGQERRTDARTLTAVDAEGRFRVESDHPVDGGEVVFDGNVTWAYLARRHQYTRVEGELLGDRVDGGQGLPNLKVLRDRFKARYRHVGERILDAKIEGEETLWVSDGEVVCTVVWARYQVPQGIAVRSVEKKFWIDPARRLILREGSKLTVKDEKRDLTMEAAQNVTFLTAQANEALPRELFAFVPPEGAVEVEDIEPDDLVGQEAAAFELEDLAGRLHRLEEMRGRVVLLDFWATWCGPCRLDLPRIEALHRELGGRGLVALGVNDEDEETARTYAEEQGHSFPTLTDPAKSLTREFGVRVLPTVVVIDRQGKVVSYLAGAHSEEDLREAVTQAGLE